MLPREESELTKKREEFTLEIRKNTREDFLRKKRIGNLDDHLQTNESKEKKEYIEECLQKQFTYDDIPFLVEHINSENLKDQYLGTIGIRKVLSLETNPPIQTVIDNNLLPKFIEFMAKNEEPSLQLESTWALINIATGNCHQTQSIIDRGGLYSLINLMNSPLPELVDQAIWALGNIAGDLVFRDVVIKEAGKLIIDKILNTSDSKSQIFKNGIWAISNLCRGKPRPNLEVLKYAIPIFARVLKEFNSENSEEIDELSDSLWALSYLSSNF